MTISADNAPTRGACPDSDDRVPVEGSAIASGDAAARRLADAGRVPIGQRPRELRHRRRAEGVQSTHNYEQVAGASACSACAPTTSAPCSSTTPPKARGADPKVIHGGWFPLALAVVMFTLLTTWQRGQALVTAKRAETDRLLKDFAEQIRTMDPPVYRAPGTAICLTSGKATMPLALRENVEHNNVVHEAVVVVSVETLKVAHVRPDEQVFVDDLGYHDDGIMHVSVRCGFQDEASCGIRTQHTSSALPISSAATRTMISSFCSSSCSTSPPHPVSSTRWSPARAARDKTKSDPRARSNTEAPTAQPSAPC